MTRGERNGSAVFRVCEGNTAAAVTVRIRVKFFVFMFVFLWLGW
jgi:hypothetical protein